MNKSEIKKYVINLLEHILVAPEYNKASDNFRHEFFRCLCEQEKQNFKNMWNEYNNEQDDTLFNIIFNKDVVI